MSQIISNYIGILFLSMGEIIFGKIVLNNKIETSKVCTIFILLVASVIFTLSSTYLEGINKTALIYIIHIFEFKMLFNLSYYKSMFLSFLFFIVIILPDILSLLIITNILGMNRIDFSHEVAGTIIGNLTIGILLIIVTLILKKPLRKIINTKISSNAKIVILCILTLLCVTIFFYIFIFHFYTSQLNKT